MATLLAMYGMPKDAAAFDAYYFSKHIPLARTVPGLRGYSVNSGGIGTPAGPSAFHLIATMTFNSSAAIQAAFASPQGQAAAADLANFADGGCELLIFDTKEV